MPECVSDRGSITRQFDYGASTCLLSCKFSSKDDSLNSEILPLSEEFISTISAKCERGISKNYDEIVNLLDLPVGHPNSLSTSQICTWLLAFSQIVSNLNQTATELVSSLLRFDWISRGEDVCKIYILFLSNLLSAHPTYAGAAIQILVSKLAISTGLESESHKTTKIHGMIRRVLDLVPSSLNFVLNTVNEVFPKKYQSVEVQTAYLRSVLEMTSYAPALREKLFEIIIDRIVRIDLDIQTEIAAVIDSEVEDRELEDNGCNELVHQTDPNPIEQDNESTECDDSSTDVDSFDFSQNKIDFESFSTDAREAVNKLDSMLNIVFIYLQEFFTSAPKSDTNAFFSYTLQIFDRLILPTYKPRYVQFIWFYMCKFDYSYYELFMGMLLTKIINKQEPEIIRVTASSYLGSFIARAQYLSICSVRMCLKLLNNWCHSYTSEYSIRNKDRTKHILFYSVVQVSMYIFCFWWKKLLISSDNEIIRNATNITKQSDKIICQGNNHVCQMYSNNSIEVQQNSREEYLIPETLNVGKFPSELDGFQNILTSKPYPLSMCPTPLAYEFARITYECNIFYCYPLINNETLSLTELNERNRNLSPKELPLDSPNNRISSSHNRKSSECQNLSTLPIESLVGSSDKLELHYPFDTTAGLLTASSFINNIFREWEDDKELSTGP